MSEAAMKSGLAQDTVYRLCRESSDFIKALREGKDNLVNIGLTGVIEIAAEPEHPKRLDACIALLKHERSGGIGGAQEVRLGWMPEGVDRENL